MRLPLSLSLAALLALMLALGTGIARAQEPAGSLALTFADGGGAKLTGACYELWTEVEGEYGERVRALCNTSGSNVLPSLPAGRYVVHETQPPQIRLVSGGPSESHVYRKAADERVTIGNGGTANVTLVHEQGARVEVTAQLPNGSPAGATCFEARVHGSTPVVDEACASSGAVTLFVPAPATISLRQTSGPDGYEPGADVQVGTALDGRHEATATMRVTVLGTIRVEQQDMAGAPITGGCYVALREVGSDEENRGTACASGGSTVAVFEGLPGGRYTFDEVQRPAGYQAAGELEATLAGGATVTVVARHRALPTVVVRTVDDSGAAVAGSCWVVKWPESNEAEAARGCDADDGADDGSTRFGTLDPDSYQLVHSMPPAGWERVDAPVPFVLGGEDEVVSVTLTRIRAPESTASPTVSGDVLVGAVLTGSPGEWRGSAPIGLATRWLRCDAAGEACAAIAGATGLAYTPTRADGGSTFRLEVSASNRGGHATARSAPTAALVLEPPVATSPPGISGAVRVGFELYGAPGSWSGRQPIATSLQWLRCDPYGEACTPIAGATGNRYAPTDAEAGSTFRLAVTAENTDGTATARSAATARLVRNEPPINLARPSILGTVKIGTRLEGREGEWYSTAGLGQTYGWLRCDAAGDSCAQIPGATGTLYTPTREDVGHRLRFAVHASNPGGTTTARSAATVVVELTAPLEVRRPEIIGTLRIGTRLEGRDGSWVSGTGSLSLTYGWLRCDAAGADCEPIPGAIYTAYTPTTWDVGYTLRFRVRADNGQATTFGSSRATAIVQAIVPVNTRRPEILGTVKLGARLEGREGQWTSGTGRLGTTYQWLRCDAAGEACLAIPGAIYTIYTLTHDDVGRTVRFEVYAENGQRTVAARSRATLPLRLAPPVNIRRPQVRGSLGDGFLLNGTDGDWHSATGRLSLTYQWLRCDAAGGQCAEIAGATTMSYRLTWADLGKRLRFQVRAENGEGVTLARSDATGLPQPVLPVNYRLPEARGLAQPGTTLSGHAGDWATAPGWTTYTYRWLRCDAAGAQCVAIPGAITTDYTLNRADAGSTLRFEVRAGSAAGATVALSERTQLVEATPPVVVALPVVQGAIRLGSRLNGTDGQWVSGAGWLSQTYQWLRCDAGGESCEPIPGAIYTSYTLTRADAGSTLRFRIRAESGQGVTFADSHATEVLELSPPVAVRRPEALGTMKLGTRLEGRDGEWYSGPGWTSYTYRWLRCDAAGESCAPIPGAVYTLYTPTREDVGHALRFEVRVEGVEGVTYGRSAATAILELVPPVNAVRPEVRGDAAVGGRLSGTHGEWYSGPGWTSYTYRWLRCDATGEACTPIAGAVSLGYEPTAADAGSRLRLEVRAENGDGPATARSDATAVVS